MATRNQGDNVVLTVVLPSSTVFRRRRKTDATHNPQWRDLMTVKSSISLTDEQHAFAKALVDTGRYATLSAVLQQGVDLLRQRTDAEETEVSALRELLSRRRNGEFVTGQRMDERLTSMIAAKRRAHGISS